jgi:hypothetical protein
MKKLHLLLATLCFGLFISCSKDDNNSGGGGSAIQSIAITASTTDAYVGDNIQFTVKGNNNVDFSTSAVIYLNTTPLVTNFFTPVATGTLSVYAVYQVSSTVTLTSPTIQIPVQQCINFNKRVLIEDYTGTWCQYCPRVAYAISQVRLQTSDAVVVAIHRGNDPYNFPEAVTLETMIGLTGYPTGMLNRKTVWTYPETSYVSQPVNLTSGTNPRVGLAMTNTISGNTVSVQVRVKFGQNLTNLKLVVYALEDNLIYNQTNSTSYYGGVNPIVNFDYDDVLRGYLTTNILGDAITGSTNLNDVYTKTFTYTIPSGYVAANMHFAAFVLDWNNKALNSRNASNNENQAFEIE